MKFTITEEQIQQILKVFRAYNMGIKDFEVMTKFLTELPKVEETK